MKPVYYAKNRKKAVHYLCRTKFKGGEIMCGQAVDATATNRPQPFTDDLPSVSCRTCAELLARRGIVLEGFTPPITGML